MECQFVSYLNQLLSKILAALLVLCFAARVSMAQLEFSNWIVGKHTILHIEPDGSSRLVDDDKFAVSNNFLISNNNGEVVVSVRFRPMSFVYSNGDILFSENVNEHTSAPFMFKSPDCAYIYILHNTYTRELTDVNLFVCKTQFRCYCKNLLDYTDEGRDILLYEEVSQYSGRDSFHTSVERPFYCAQSSSDGRTVWVILKCQEDKFVIERLDGYNIVETKEIHYDLNNTTLTGVGTMTTTFTASDDGKIFCDLFDAAGVLCIYFNKKEGNIEGHSIFDISSLNKDMEVSSSGKYLYYISGEKIYRQRISDMEQGVYNAELVSSEAQAYSAMQSNLKIGIDGNIYVHTGKAELSVIRDSESEKPRLETLYADIPDAYIVFPNYLRTNETFVCNVSCDKTVSFYYIDAKNEVGSYKWDFGDGYKSAESNPIHIYAETGDYNVTLELVLKNGQRKIVPSKMITIKEMKTPQIICE